MVKLHTPSNSALHPFSILRLLLLVGLASYTNAAQNFTTAHNVTSLTGTWSSGSHSVLTGKGFVDPTQVVFDYPKNGGVSYSFSDDGFYEVSRFRFVGNGQKPRCFTTVIGWAHGTFQHTDDTGLILTPWGDGFQQIQDPCGANTNFMEIYNQTEQYMGWLIQDEPEGIRLRMYEFDGTPVAPMTLASDSLLMYPAKAMRNLTTVVLG